MCLSYYPSRNYTAVHILYCCQMTTFDLMNEYYAAANHSSMVLFSTAFGNIGVLICHANKGYLISVSYTVISTCCRLQTGEWGCCPLQNVSAGCLDAGGGRKLGVPGDLHFPFEACGPALVTLVVFRTAVVPIRAAHSLLGEMRVVLLSRNHSVLNVFAIFKQNKKL